MNANFFSQIAQMQITGDLHITIAKGAENKLIVSVMLDNVQCGDNAKNGIPPLTLRGTADELDNGFFEKVTTPIETASGLMVDMEVFMNQLEETKKQSAMEKDKTDRQKKEQQAQENKFTQAMAKAQDLEAIGKFREAWIKVPEITEFPEKAEEIRKRKRELSEKFSAPSLFGAMQEEKNEAEKTDEVTECCTEEAEELEE